jgi:hypothetical protein
MIFFIEKMMNWSYLESMSPTVFRYKNYRFYFFSREEKRIHIHIYCPDGEAKYWMEPDIELANNYGLTEQQLAEIKKVLEDRQDEIHNAWNQHFRD